MSKQNNNPLLILTAIALITGVGLIAANKNPGSAINSPGSASCIDPNCALAEDKGEYIYISLQPNNAELALLTDDLLYEFSRQAKKDQIYDLDLLNGDRIEAFFKGKLDRQVIKGIRKDFDANPNTVEIDPTFSSNRALVQGVNRLVGLATANAEKHHFKAVIVTPGTSDPDTIARIQEISQRLADSGKAENVRIYLVGLDPAHRIKTMSAFHPLAANTSSATASYSEWSRLLRKL